MRCVAIGAGSSVRDVEGGYVPWSVCRSTRKIALQDTGHEGINEMLWTLMTLDENVAPLFPFTCGLRHRACEYIELRPLLIFDMKVLKK